MVIFKDFNIKIEIFNSIDSFEKIENIKSNQTHVKQSIFYMKNLHTMRGDKKS